MQKINVEGISNNTTNIILPYKNDSNLNLSINLLKLNDDVIYRNAGYNDLNESKFDNIETSDMNFDLDQKKIFWESNYNRNQGNNIKWDESQYQLSFNITTYSPSKKYLARSIFFKKKYYNYLKRKYSKKTIEEVKADSLDYNKNKDFILNLSLKNTLNSKPSFQIGMELGHMFRNARFPFIFLIGYSATSRVVDYEIIDSHSSGYDTPPHTFMLYKDKTTVTSGNLFFKSNIYKKFDEKKYFFMGICMNDTSLDIPINYTDSPDLNLGYNIINLGLIYKYNQNFTIISSINNAFSLRDNITLNEVRYNFSLSYLP